MRTYAYDVLVFICRAQPFHNAHFKILTRALALGKRVIVVLGSHLSAVNTYNPFKAVERETQILACFDEEDRNRISVVYVRDYPYSNSSWLGEVHMKVKEIVYKERPDHVGWSDYDSGDKEPFKTGIIGYKKDFTSAYLEWFPHWEFIDTATFSKGVSATDIRASYFMKKIDWSKEVDPEYPRFLSSRTLKEAVEKAESYKWQEHVQTPVFKWLLDFQRNQPARYASLVAEFKHVLKKKSLKEDYPFPIIEHTVDAVVEKSAHVLMIKRGKDPGRGLWALPGGYLGEFESEFDAAVRELEEETRINFFHGARMSPQNMKAESRKEIIKCYTGDCKSFDAPHRSVRGRVITMAFHFELPSDANFPFVKGDDDAIEAKWIPRGELGFMREFIFEDHADILEHFLMKNSSKKWQRGA